MVELNYGPKDFGSKGEWQKACQQWCLEHGYEKGDRGKLARPLSVPAKPEKGRDGAKNPDYLQDMSEGKI